MLEAMDQIGLAPQGAGWFYYHDLGDWRYHVITPLVDTIGERKVYRLIDDALERIGPVDGLSIFDIYLMSPKHPAFLFVAGTFVVSGVGEVTVTDCLVNGIPFDAVLYRIEKTSTTPPTKLSRSFERKVSQLVVA